MSPGRVLHLLSQRPGYTGSGITLRALVRGAKRAGWEQAIVAGVPPEEADCVIEGIPIRPVVFSGSDLPFPVVGMSDVMPYESARFSELTKGELDLYRNVFREHLERAVQSFAPDVIHSHHIWLMSSIIKDVAKDIPVVTHCHATGLRQMKLCPELRDEVVQGVRRNERFVVLHEGHRAELVDCLGVSADRVRVVGAGFREEVFVPGSQRQGPVRFVFAGKFSCAKGLPELLDAVALIFAKRPDWTLHVAGGGGGSESDLLRVRMEGMAPSVQVHGMLDQDRLAELFRSCHVFVLPSFYEGLPLVLVEAFASGCRLISTDLPGIRAVLKPALNEGLHLVAAPEMSGPDRPTDRARPEFVARLSNAVLDVGDGINAALPDSTSFDSLRPFRWAAVFGRVERSWTDET